MESNEEKSPLSRLLEDRYMLLHIMELLDDLDELRSIPTVSRSASQRTVSVKACIGRRFVAGMLELSLIFGIGITHINSLYWETIC